MLSGGGEEESNSEALCGSFKDSHSGHFYVANCRVIGLWL